MKKLTSLTLTAAVLLSLYGCGDNKTKEKLLGTTIVNSTVISGSSSGSYTSNPTASSVTTLYNASFMGSGAGSFSYGAPRRSFGRAISGGGGAGLGTPDANGDYKINDSHSLGMTVTLSFEKNSQKVYMNLDNAFANGGLYMYAPVGTTKSLSGTKYTLSGSADANTVGYYLSQVGSLYIPSIWIKASDQTPIDWYEVTSSKFQNALNDLNTWMTATTFPDKMTNTVSGTIPGGGGTMNMTMTSDMPITGKPTNLLTASMSGSGTISFTSGETWAIITNMSIGDNGPVSGTQSFSSSNGTSGTMTFASDGSMTGVILSGTTTIATISVNANGTGTYTDTATGKTYSISGAKPS